MSVQLFTSHGIKHGNSSMNVPPELIEVHLGVPYIKLVAQSVPLMKAIFPEVKIQKNATLSHSSVIQRLTQERNVLQGLADDDTAENPAQALFGGGDAGEPTKKKRKKKQRAIRDIIRWDQNYGCQRSKESSLYTDGNT